MFLRIFIAALIFRTITSVGTETQHTTRIRTLTVCINVVTNGDTEALCPPDGPPNIPTSVDDAIHDVLTAPLPLRKEWVEVTTPLGVDLGSVEIQAYFPLDKFNVEYTIPKMVTTLKFPAKETDVYFDPAGAGCLKNKDGFGWKLPECPNCWTQTRVNDRVKENPYWVVGYTPPTTTEPQYVNENPGGYIVATNPDQTTPNPSVPPDSSSTESLASNSAQVTDGVESGASTAEPTDSGTTSPSVTEETNAPSVGRRRLPRFYI